MITKRLDDRGLRERGDLLAKVLKHRPLRRGVIAGDDVYRAARFHDAIHRPPRIHRLTVDGLDPCDAVALQLLRQGADKFPVLVVVAGCDEDAASLGQRALDQARDLPAGGGTGGMLNVPRSPTEERAEEQQGAEHSVI